MKPLPLLLAASLVANAAFVAVHAFRDSSPDASSSASAAAAAKNAAGATSLATEKQAAASAENLLAALKANDLTALRDLLRAAGVPDEMIRNVLGASVWKRYGEFMKTLRPKNQAEWWKQDNDWYRQTTREQRAEMRRLQREAQDEIERLLGKEKDSSNWWADNRYGFLPETKRKDVQEIEQDYQDLIQEVQQEMQGLTLPSDTEKIKFLMEEKKRDLAALLSPQELADYELRMSPTAQQLRWKMTKFDGSEEEYRKIFALHQNAMAGVTTDAWGNPVGNSPDDWKKRQEAEKQLNAQIKQALGDQRYADYVRSQNHEYQQLTSISKRLNLPPDTAKNVYELRNTVSAESQRIADNPGLAPEQKKEAFVALANKTRDQIRASLGDEAAEVYMKNSLHWLKNVEQGNVITFGEDGSQSSRPGINPPAKKSAPKS